MYYYLTIEKRNFGIILPESEASLIFTMRIKYEHPKKEK